MAIYDPNLGDIDIPLH